MESLFSLEIHVESVEALQVICRLPAVSFRLLDFPTLIIHHVSPTMAEKVRHKILMETGGNGSSLEDLKDRRGNFQFQKGKSCLFKANIDVLQSQLQTTPLYVMLLDLWPKKPKLVGSGGIEMKTAIDTIHKQVRGKGVAVPSFYKEFGDFDLFNLMGSAIARVKLGYRLVSLGGSLIPHVPTATMTSKREENQELTEYIDEDIVEESDIVIREPAPAEKDSIKKQQVSEHRHTHTQTTLVSTSKTYPRLPVEDKEGQDLIITNTVCPPPLYFNAFSESQTKSVTEPPTQDRKSSVYNTNIGYAGDDVDLEHDHAFVLMGEKTHCTSVSVQTDPTVTKAQPGSQDEAVMQQPTNRLRGLFTAMETVPSARYPILNALFQELSSVTTQQHKDEDGRLNAWRESGKSNKQESQRLLVTTKPAKSQISQKGLTTAKKTMASVPKNSSVIGLPRQKVRFKQTSLTYKTTRTQQMRLAQNLRGQIDRGRLCAAVSQHADQHGTAKQTPEQSHARDLGITFKKDQRQVETTAAGMQRADGAKDKAMTESISSPAGSVVHSARSYRSQNSLEIFLPTADGETDTSCCTEEPTHPPPDNKFGHTGILNQATEQPGTQLPPTTTSHDDDFDDTTSWHDNNTLDSKHSLLHSSESCMSDNASELSNGVKKSGKFRPPISKSPLKISRSHRPKSADSLIQRVSLSDTYLRETRSSSALFDLQEISQQVDKQSLSLDGSTAREKGSADDGSYSEDFLSGSEAEQSEPQKSDSNED